jgi:hypothetical protein
MRARPGFGLRHQACALPATTVRAQQAGIQMVHMARASQAAAMQADEVYGSIVDLGQQGSARLVLKFARNSGADGGHILRTLAGFK